MALLRAAAYCFVIAVMGILILASGVASDAALPYVHADNLEVILRKAQGEDEVRRAIREYYETSVERDTFVECAVGAVIAGLASLSTWELLREWMKNRGPTKGEKSASGPRT